jgi:hypothetical protein
MHRARRLKPLVLVLICLAAPARAQESVGTVAAVEGKADLVRGTATQAITVGAAIAVGDHVRTGKPGRVRIVFRDETTLNVGDGSDLAIGENVFKPDEGAVSSAIRLLSGKVRALVSEYYKDPLTSYQVETATAVSGVRGTDFIVVFRDADAVTDVVGLTGRVEVHGVVDRRGHGVIVTPKTKTTVARGGYPTEPKPVSDAELGAYLEGLDFIGGGANESMLLDSPIIEKGALPPEDVGGGGAQPGAAGGTAAAPIAGSPSSLTPSPNTEQPQQPGDRSSPAGVIQQPPAAVERLGDIGVEFDRAKRLPSHRK